jgi:hypothetical protein
LRGAFGRRTGSRRKRQQKAQDDWTDHEPDTLPPPSTLTSVGLVEEATNNDR